MFWPNIYTTYFENVAFSAATQTIIPIIKDDLIKNDET